MFVGTTGIDRVVERTAMLMQEHDTDDIARYGGIPLNCSEVDDHDRGVDAGNPVGRGQRELGLADATGADERHEAVLPEQRLQLDQLLLAADETVRDGARTAPAQSGRSRSGDRDDRPHGRVPGRSEQAISVAVQESKTRGEQPDGVLPGPRDPAG